VRRADFETMARAMAAEVPREFLDGIVAIEVTGKTVPHPVRADVYTLGECIPHATGGPDDEGPTIRSSVELHYGSFAALARLQQGFDWRHEAWETLTHELRHHLEWRARVPALEALDDAVEANYARLDGEPFPPTFHLHGEPVADGVTKVEDDVFIDVVLPAGEWKRAAGTEREFVWHGRRWRVRLPERLGDALFLTIREAKPEPAGDLVLVMRRRPGARDLVRRAAVMQAEAPATPAS
jgi:hypothetical protein